MKDMLRFRSVREEVVDVFVRDVRERGSPYRSGAFGFLTDCLDDLPQSGNGFADSKSYEPQRTAVVEDHSEDHLCRDSRDVKTGPSTLVEVDGEVVFSHQAGQARGGRYASRAEGRDAGRVDVAEFARFGDQLSVHVHHEDRERIRIPDQLVDDHLNFSVIFFKEQELLISHLQNSR